MNAWDQIKRRLERKLTPEDYRNWIARTSFGRIEGRALLVHVPDTTTRRWLEVEWGGLIQSSLESLDEPKVDEVRYEVAAVAEADEAGPQLAALDGLQAHLNPRFTFDTFVVGSCNQFAHAAAKAVAKAPSKSYNPLFIHGGVGMGKTHLMHAVGRSLLDNYAGMKIVYTSSERFMNEMIASIRQDRMPEFKSHYRSADVLLVDDIQILSGKERTQDEFFHTFNELYENRKQIIISSDSSPKEIPGLVERLRSRFEWGLMVDIQPPDLETKMAILDKKAEDEGVNLPDEVRTFIATKTKSNVRELEGALVKLIAFQSLTGESISLDMATQILKHLANAPEKRITIDMIQKMVAEHFNLKQSQLKEKSNTQAIVFPRQIAMYLCKELTTHSLPEIGRAFGGKHHTTVLHSIKKIEELRKSNPEVNKLVQKLLDSFQ